MQFPKGVQKTKQPKISYNVFDNTRGRYWEHCSVLLPDRKSIDAYYEKMRGTYFYFEVNAQWYKASIDTFDTGKSRHTITPELFEFRNEFDESPCI